MSCAVAIFVKTPGRSPVKTRLAARLGRAMAEDWYRRSAACVADAVRASGLPGYWAVAERAALDDPLWADLPRVHQGDGSLGRRMATVHDALIGRHGGAVLVGADLPQLDAAELRAAAEWLDAEVPRRVLGPARDGGFWLFGSNRSHPLESWRSVRYSATDTAARFVEAIGGEDWLTLDSRSDVDVAGDLAAARAELRSLAAPTPRQQALVRWLESRPREVE